MPKIGTFTSNKPKIHFATIIRDPRELVISHYLYNHLWDENEFMAYIESHQYYPGSLLWRYAGEWCYTHGKSSIVDNIDRFEVCSNAAMEWLNKFEIICFIDDMNECVYHIVTNYFCVANKKHCKTQNSIKNIIKKYQIEFKEYMSQNKEKIWVKWDEYVDNQLINEKNIEKIEQVLKYEILFYNLLKKQYGSGKFESENVV